MKNIILIIILGVLFVSCKSQEMVYLGNGKQVTQNQYEKYVMKIIKKSFKSLPKQDKKLLTSTPTKFEYEVK